MARGAAICRVRHRVLSNSACTFRKEYWRPRRGECRSPASLSRTVADSAASKEFLYAAGVVHATRQSGSMTCCTETKGLWICGQFACGEPGRLPWITIKPLSTAHPFAHKLHRPLSISIYFHEEETKGQQTACKLHPSIAFATADVCNREGLTKCDLRAPTTEWVCSPKQQRLNCRCLARKQGGNRSRIRLPVCGDRSHASGAPQRDENGRC